MQTQSETTEPLTNSTSEREQRLKEIRERRNALQLRHGDWPCQTVHNSKERAFQQYVLADMDFLLSLLDSKAAGGDVRPSTRQGESIVKQARENAATRMRDLCVAKVKAMAAQDRRFGAEYNLIRALGYDLVVTELQSITLEQEQK